MFGLYQAEPLLFSSQYVSLCIEGKDRSIVPFYCNPWAYRTSDNSPWVNPGASQSSRLLLSRIEIAA